MEIFFIILLVVIGYAALLKVVLTSMQTAMPVSTVAVVLLLVYLCLIGLLGAAGQYLGETGLLLYALAVVYSLFYTLWQLYRQLKNRIPFRAGAMLGLFAYLLAVFYITAFHRAAQSNNEVQMHLLHWLDLQSADQLKHVLFNVVMFIPLGALIPLSVRETRGMVARGVSVGMLISVIIETSQLIFQIGTCDIDDIIANTLGAAIGALAVRLFSGRAR